MNEMYSMGNIFNNYIIPLCGDIVTRLIMVISLKGTEIANHYIA